MAVHFKLITLGKCVYPLYVNGLGKAAGLLQTAEEAYAIRAATVAACERVVQLTAEVAEKAGKEWLKSMTAMNLCGLLTIDMKRCKLIER